jgi:hypothetical protein
VTQLVMFLDAKFGSLFSSDSSLAPAGQQKGDILTSG